MGNVIQAKEYLMRMAELNYTKYEYIILMGYHAYYTGDARHYSKEYIKNWEIVTGKKILPERAAFIKAIDNDPNDPKARLAYIIWLMKIGEDDEVVRQSRILNTGIGW